MICIHLILEFWINGYIHYPLIHLFLIQVLCTLIYTLYYLYCKTLYHLMWVWDMEIYTCITTYFGLGTLIYTLHITYIVRNCITVYRHYLLWVGDVEYVGLDGVHAEVVTQYLGEPYLPDLCQLFCNTKPNNMYIQFDWFISLISIRIA